MAKIKSITRRITASVLVAGWGALMLSGCKAGPPAGPNASSQAVITTALANTATLEAADPPAAQPGRSPSDAPAQAYLELQAAYPELEAAYPPIMGGWTPEPFLAFPGHPSPPTPYPLIRTPLEPAASPTAFQTPYWTPTSPPYVWEQISYPICTQGGVMQTCVDELLRLQFKVPVGWGEIRARLAKGGDSGLKYGYSFGTPGAAQAGGNSRDFSEGRERLWTDFWGFRGYSPEQVCGWFSSPYSCEVIQPKIILVYLYPSAASVCDPGPGSVYSPVTLLAIDLPENEQINGFVFVGSLLSQAGQAELDQAYHALGGAAGVPLYQGCDESRMAAFDVYVQGLIERVQQNNVDRDTLNIIDTWHRIANSIKPVKR